MNLSDSSMPGPAHTQAGTPGPGTVSPAGPVRPERVLPPGPRRRLPHPLRRGARAAAGHGRPAFAPVAPPGPGRREGAAVGLPKQLRIVGRGSIGVIVSDSAAGERRSE